MSEPWKFLLTVALGFVTGMMSGAFGIGGAVISTPGIRALGATPLEGVGSTLPSILPSAITATIRYRRAHLIHARIVAWCAAAGVFAAVAGALLTRVIPGKGHILMLATALLLAFNAFTIARKRRVATPTPTPDANASHADRTDEVRPRPPAWKLLTTGGCAGLLSGLLGLGGGIVMVPLFIRWLRLTTKEAVATSIACVAIIATPSIITHQIIGNINWYYAGGLCIAVIPGAWLGSSLAVRTEEGRLRITVAIVLGVVAVYYAISELIALVSS